MASCDPHFDVGKRPTRMRSGAIETQARDKWSMAAKQLHPRMRADAPLPWTVRPPPSSLVFGRFGCTEVRIQIHPTPSSSDVVSTWRRGWLVMTHGARVDGEPCKEDHPRVEHDEREKVGTYVDDTEQDEGIVTDSPSVRASMQAEGRRNPRVTLSQRQASWRRKRHTRTFHPSDVTKPIVRSEWIRDSKIDHSPAKRRTTYVLQKLSARRASLEDS